MKELKAEMFYSFSISEQCLAHHRYSMHVYGVEELINELKQVYFVGKQKNHFKLLLYKRLISFLFLISVT